jgi:hypothetical protein
VIFKTGRYLEKCQRGVVEEEQNRANGKGAGVAITTY